MNEHSQARQTINKDDRMQNISTPLKIISQDISSILTPYAISRFWKFVEKTETCWNWKGGIENWGYGIFAHQIEGKKQRITARAHRFIWTALFGSIPNGFYVCHRCDNPKCVRPSHLFLGTPKDNAFDRDQKGRAGKTGYKQTPETAFKGKINPEKAKEIRRLHLTEGVTQADLAKQFGVCNQSISNVILKKTWWKVLPTDQRVSP